MNASSAVAEPMSSIELIALADEVRKRNDSRVPPYLPDDLLTRVEVALIVLAKAQQVSTISDPGHSAAAPLNVWGREQHVEAAKAVAAVEAANRRTAAAQSVPGAVTDQQRLDLAKAVYFSVGGRQDDERRAQKVSRIQLAIEHGGDGVPDLTCFAHPPSPAGALPGREVLHPLSEIQEWDEALAELGIQESDQTPAEAIRELKAEIEKLSENHPAIAEQMVGAIEDRFPNWRSYRDLIDCIDCTLHELRASQAPAVAREEIAEIRKRVRNAWGAVSSGQVEDKDVQGQLKRLLDWIDALLASRTASGAGEMNEIHESDGGVESRHARTCDGPADPSTEGVTQAGADYMSGKHRERKEAGIAPGPSDPTPSPRALDANDALNWLAENINLELSHQGWDEEPCWQVHRVNGGRNDREWTLLGEGETPLDAIVIAHRRALSPDRSA